MKVQIHRKFFRIFILGFSHIIYPATSQYKYTFSEPSWNGERSKTGKVVISTKKIATKPNIALNSVNTIQGLIIKL